MYLNVNECTPIKDYIQRKRDIEDREIEEKRREKREINPSKPQTSRSINLTFIMTSILERLNSEDDDGGRVEHLEKELRTTRNAFEEFISSTQDLEVDMNKELNTMRKLPIYLSNYLFICIESELRYSHTKSLLGLLLTTKQRVNWNILLQQTTNWQKSYKVWSPC